MPLFSAGSTEICDLHTKITRNDHTFDFDPDEFIRLTPSERHRAVFYFLSIRERVNNLIYQYKRGLLDEETYFASVQATARTYIPVWRALGILAGSST